MHLHTNNLLNYIVILSWAWFIESYMASSTDVKVFHTRIRLCYHNSHHFLTSTCLLFELLEWKFLTRIFEVKVLTCLRDLLVWQFLLILWTPTTTMTSNKKLSQILHSVISWIYFPSASDDIPCKYELQHHKLKINTYYCSVIQLYQMKVAKLFLT